MNKSELKYYIYVSDTKVNMLYEQIPQRLRDNLATELKIDLKILSTTFSEEPTEATRFSKLKVVNEYIAKNEPLGTVDASEYYFYGKMKIRWIACGDIVFFFGTTPNTVLILGGASGHLIGSEPAHNMNASTLWGIDRALQEMDREEFGLDDSVENEPGTIVQKHWGSGMGRDALQFVITVSRVQSRRLPAQSLEFLAKRLWDEKISAGFYRIRFPYLIEAGMLEEDAISGEEPQILIGSPIYVALAE
jgi:hypothetical protein